MQAQKNIKKAIRDEIIRRLESGISQRSLAVQLKTSEATIDNIKNNRWNNKISDRMINKLRNQLRIDSWGLRDTYNFRVVKKVCEDARTNSRFMAISGFTGGGKTTAALHYANNTTNAYYLLATAIDTRKTFVRKIQQSLGISEGQGIQQMLLAAITKMQSLSQPVLIIDDAGKLNDSCLRLIQIIYDNTEFSAGIVLMGTEYLKRLIDMKSKNNTMGFRELRRRISYWQPLRRPSKQVIKTICEDHGITDAPSIKFIADRAEDYGTLRNLIENAVRAAEAAGGEPVSRELLEGMAVGDYHFN